MAALAIASAAGGAVAGCHPTGTPVVDPLYTAALAAVVTVATSRARRASWLLLAATAVALSRGLVLLPAVVALGVAFASVFARRTRQRVGALVGALAIQAVLRWPHLGFQGLTAIVATLAIATCAISAYGQLSRPARRRTRRLALGGVVGLAILSIPAALGGLGAKAPVGAAVADTAGALSAISDGGAVSGTAKLASASAELATAHARAGSWWSAGARLVPIVAQQRQAIAQATATAQNLTVAAQHEAATVDIHAFGSVNGRLDVAAIAAAGPPLRALNTQIVDARATLRGLSSGWLATPIASRLANFDAQLTKAGGNVELASEVTRAAPGLLGAKGTRHYFVAFMTPSESRGLDGFIGSFAELTADQGRITLSRSGPIAELNANIPPGGRRLTGVGDYLARYGGFGPANRFQDVAYSPDFPTVTTVISELYPQTGGDQLDGVLALDPSGLSALLRFTGPIAVPGLPQPLTEANAADVLLKDQYNTFGAGRDVARHDFLQDALSLAFDRLVHTTLPGPAELSAALDPQVRQGRFLLWSNHLEDQAVLRRVRLDGSFPRAAGGDVLAVTTQNAANNKIDAYLERRVDDQIIFDPATGKVTGRVSIALHNAAPAAGLPVDVLGSYTGSGLPSGTNRTWLSVYTPFGLTRATRDGVALSLSSTPELGVNAYSTYVNIPPGATLNVTLDLAGVVPAGRSYNLVVRRQPMVNAGQNTVTLRPSAGWSTPDAGPWTVGPDQRSRHRFTFAPTG